MNEPKSNEVNKEIDGDFHKTSDISSEHTAFITALGRERDAALNEVNKLSHVVKDQAKALITWRRAFDSSGGQIGLLQRRLEEAYEAKEHINNLYFEVCNQKLEVEGKNKRLREALDKSMVALGKAMTLLEKLSGVRS